LEFGGIPADGVRLPRVEVSASAPSSSYSSLGNKIIIAERHIGSADTYAEEIFHCIHAHLKPAAKSAFDVLPEVENSSVDEFIAFVGTAIVKRLMDGEAPNDLVRGFRHDQGDSFVTGLTSEQAEIAERLQALTSPKAKQKSEAFQVLSTYLMMQSMVPFEPASQGTDPIESTIANVSKAIGNLEDEINSCKPLLQIETNLLRLLRVANKDFDDRVSAFRRRGSSKENEDSIRGIPHVLAQLSTHITAELAKIEEAISALKTRDESLEKHRSGYEAGLLYLQHNPQPEQQVFELMRMSPKEVYLRHIFGRTLSTPEGPSRLSILRESLRLNIRRLFAPVSPLELLRDHPPTA